MWWSQEEEDLQKRYIAAWGEAADNDLADLAADFADLAADPPDPPDGLPLVNGFHILLPPLNLHQGGADAH